jgi:hypothetical protein
VKLQKTCDKNVQKNLKNTASDPFPLGEERRCALYVLKFSEEIATSS